MPRHELHEIGLAFGPSLGENARKVGLHRRLGDTENGRHLGHAADVNSGQSTRISVGVSL